MLVPTLIHECFKPHTCVLNTPTPPYLQRAESQQVTIIVKNPETKMFWEVRIRKYKLKILSSDKTRDKKERGIKNLRISHLKKKFKTKIDKNQHPKWEACYF